MILTWHKRDENNRRYKVMSISERDILQCLVRPTTQIGDYLNMLSFDLPEHTELVGIYDNNFMACKDAILFNPAWPILKEAQFAERITANSHPMSVDRRIENPDPAAIVSRIMAMRNAPAPTKNDPTFDVICIPDPWNLGKTFPVRMNQYIHLLNGLGIQTPTGFHTAEEIAGLPGGDGPYRSTWGEASSHGKAFVAAKERLHRVIKEEEADCIKRTLGKSKAEDLDPFKKSWRDEPSFLGGTSG